MPPSSPFRYSMLPGRGGRGAVKYRQQVPTPAAVPNTYTTQSSCVYPFTDHKCAYQCTECGRHTLIWHSVDVQLLGASQRCVFSHLLQPAGGCGFLPCMCCCCCCLVDVELVESSKMT